MKTQILLFSFLCIFTCSLQAQDQQQNAILHSGSERVGAWFNPTRSGGILNPGDFANSKSPGFNDAELLSMQKYGKRNQPKYSDAPMMVPAKRNMLIPSTSVWKWDTIMCYNTSSGSTPFQKVSRTYNSSGDSLTQLTEHRQGSYIWENYAKETFTYDSAGNWLTYLAEAWQNNAWANHSKKEFIYNASGDMTDWKTAGWQSNVWVNGWHYSYHFDSNGLTDTVTYQVGQGSLWVNYILWIPTYDGNGYMTSSLTYTWINNGWEVNYRDTFTNNSNGNALIDLRQNWVNSLWVNNAFIIQAWDSAGHCLSSLHQEWQNNAWVNTYVMSYTYDSNGNRTMFLFQNWLSGSWVNGDQSLYAYDASNNMLSETYQNWDNSYWLNIYMQQYTYDSLGNSLTGKCLEWYQNAWYPYDGTPYVFADHQTDGQVNLIEVYRYSAVIDSIMVFTEPSLSQGHVTLYPNPAHSRIYISSPTASTDPHGSLTLYDLRGQFLLTKQIEKETTGIDISGLKPGVYFVRFSNNKLTRVLKFVKE